MPATPSSKHDCGPGGLRSCETHPKVHVTRDRDNTTWTVWKPSAPDGVCLVASLGYQDQEAAMRYARELARILAYQ
jgi:hypothetical protein